MRREPVRSTAAGVMLRMPDLSESSNNIRILHNARNFGRHRTSPSRRYTRQSAWFAGTTAKSIKTGVAKNACRIRPLPFGTRQKRYGGCNGCFSCPSSITSTSRCKCRTESCATTRAGIATGSAVSESALCSETVSFLLAGRKALPPRSSERSVALPGDARPAPIAAWLLQIRPTSLCLARRRSRRRCARTLPGTSALGKTSDVSGQTRSLYHWEVNEFRLALASQNSQAAP